MNKRTILAVILAVAMADVAVAARFNIVGGGNLDDAGNWTSGYSTMAVYQQLTGPLTISADNVMLPGAQGNLVYGNGTFCNTNMFTAGWTLDLNGKSLMVNGGSTLVHMSGTIQAGGDSLVQANEASKPSTMIFTGPNAVFKGTSLQTRITGSPTEPVFPAIVFTNGASAILTGSLVMNGGYNATRSLFAGEGTSVTAGSVSMGDQDADLPGVRRTLTFDDHATATFTSACVVGKVSGGNDLVVRGGATATFKSSLSVTVPDGNAASSNNTVTVDGGKIVMENDIGVGYNVQATNNSFVVRNGGQLLASDGGRTNVLIVGYQGSLSSFVAEGAGTLVDYTGGKVFVGGRASGTTWNNTLKVLDGATLNAGEELDIGITGSGNTVVISNATLTAKAISNYSTGNLIRAFGSTIVVTNGLANYSGRSGLRASFEDCDVMFSMNMAAYSGVGGADAHISFKDCRVRNPNRFNPSGVGFEMSFDNTDVDFPADEYFITGTTTGPDNETSFLFSGTNTHIRISGSKGLYLRGNTVSFEFDIPAAGVSKSHPVIDLQHSSAAVSADAACESSLVVSVDPRCPPGTYTLIRGKNCTSKFKSYTCDSKSARILLTQVDGVDAVQVRVSGGMRIIFR